MSFPVDLIHDLQALSPAQMKDAAAYVKALRSGDRGKHAKAKAPSRARPVHTFPPDLFLSVYADSLCIQECDQASLDVLGTGAVGKPFLKLIDPEFRESAAHAFDTVRNYKETKNVRLCILCADGGSLPVTMAARWVDPHLHTPALIDVVCRDISYLKRSGNIEIFSEMLSIGIVLLDEGGHIAFVNSAARRLFGYEQGELENQPWTMLLPDSASQKEANPGIDRTFNRELNGRAKSGAAIPLEVAWSSIRLSDQRFAVASITDLTTRKSIENVLRKHEEERALIFSEGLVGDFTWNIGRDEVVAHSTVFGLYGSPPIAGPVPGNWFRSRQHPDEAFEIHEKWFSQMAAGDKLALEFRVNGDDGVTRWVDCRGVVIRDAAGNPIQVHGLNIDITARKQAELERLESEARARKAEELLRTALQYSNTVVWRWNIDENRLDWWGAVKELYGVEASALTRVEDFRRVVVPEDLAEVQDMIARNRDNSKDLYHEFRIMRPGGEIRWVASCAGIFRDGQGRVNGMAGVNFDVTDRKIAEEERKQSDRDFRELTNQIPQIVFTSNAEGVVEYHNQRYYEITGFPPEAKPNLRWPEILNVEDRERTLSTWLECAASGQLYQQECRIWDWCLEQQRWYLVRAVPVRNAKGTIVRWIGTGTDIHDQKTAEERLEIEVQNRTVDLHQSLTLLQQREEQLEKSLQEKDAMLREIHHRVKNNLQIVSSLLKMQAETAGNSAAVATLRDSERRIASMAMIHEQLYSTEDMQTVDFAEHANRLSQSLLASMTENPRITCRAKLDPVKLAIHQAIPCALILNELLTNAFKYAYPGEAGGPIDVILAADPDGSITMSVSDKGVGLPVDVDPYRPKTLGLEIVQVLVGQLDGELTVQGSPGATFSVKFHPQEEDSRTVDNTQSRSAAASNSRN